MDKMYGSFEIKRGFLNLFSLGEFLLLAFLMAFTLVGCNKANYIQAKEKHQRGEYFEAANLYRKVYTHTSSKDKKKRGEVAFAMAECYEKINFLPRALNGYKNALRYRVKDSVSALRIAQILYKQGKYQQASQNLKEYLTLYPNHKDANAILLGCTMAQQWKEMPPPYIVKKSRIFNSRRSDFSPMIVGEFCDNLYYTSSNDKFSKKYTKSPVTGVKDYDIFFSKKNEKGIWLKAEPVLGELNTKGDEGVVTLTGNKSKMYLSCCKDAESGYGKVFLAVSQKEGERWGKYTPLHFWGDTTAMIAHPALSPDEKYLYFVSDRIGGYGGKDIWRVSIEEGSIGTPENLGPQINTEKDEMFPYFRSNGEFYFSSNGWVGMGGLDIFRARHSENGADWIVENMKYPINSCGDDFGITFEGASEKGFFSSSRNDGKGWDHIYSFEIPNTKVLVEGFVVDREDYILPKATIRVVGNDGTIIKTKPKVDGTYSILLDYGKSYIMQALAKGYLGDRHQISTLSNKKDTSYIRDFVLTPVNRSVSIENIYYEFGKSTLLSTSYGALDNLVEMMKSFLTISIELSAHTDRKGNESYNQKLSLERAKSVVNYLIEKGISPQRLSAKGYGSSVPKEVTKKMASTYPDFLHEGDILNDEFINRLPPKQQEIADQLNRRTEFVIVSGG